VSPVKLNVVEPVVPAGWPLTNMWYASTPRSSIDAVHEVAIEVGAAPVLTKFVGALGGVVSAPPATCVFMSPWTSAAVSARLYRRTSSMSPLKNSG
jgi:hypothetical protein